MKLAVKSGLPLDLWDLCDNARVQILGLPFRFNPLQPGSFHKVEQGSDEQKAQEIASFTLTHKGERPLYQDYGVEDPTFQPFDETDLSANFSTFYEESNIEITEITVTQIDQSQTQIEVQFT